MPTPSHAELRREHDLIDLLAKRLAELIDGHAEPNILSTALEHLVQTVRDHLAKEDAMIYTLAMRAQPGITQDAVERTHSEFELLKANWTDYLTSWSGAAIAANRKGFVEATRAMLPRLRDRVRFESELLLASALIKPAAAR